MKAYVVQTANTRIPMVPLFPGSDGTGRMTLTDRTPIDFPRGSKYKITYPSAAHLFYTMKALFEFPVDQWPEQTLHIRGKIEHGDVTRLRRHAHRTTYEWSAKTRRAWDHAVPDVVETICREKIIQQGDPITTFLLDSLDTCLVLVDAAPLGVGDDHTGANVMGVTWMKIRNEMFQLQQRPELQIVISIVYAHLQRALQAAGISLSEYMRSSATLILPAFDAPVF